MDISLLGVWEQVDSAVSKLVISAGVRRSQGTHCRTGSPWIATCRKWA
jgi:hypothetical protein